MKKFLIDMIDKGLYYALLAALAAETALLVYLGGKAVSAWARVI